MSQNNFNPSPYCKAVAAESPIGIVPDNLLFPKCIDVSAVSNETVLGRVPTRLFDGSVKFLAKIKRM